LARSWKEGRRIEKLQEVKEEARKSEQKRKHSTPIGPEVKLRENGIQKGIINPEKRCKASEFSDRT